jgi:hypothetical protein
MAADALGAAVPAAAAEDGMIRREQREAALFSMLRAWRSYGDQPFTVNRFGDHWRSLHNAETLGWCTFIGDRCRLTAAGIEEVLPFGGKIEAELMAEAAR